MDINKLIENRYDFPHITSTTPLGEEFEATLVTNTTGYGKRHEKIVLVFDEIVKIADFDDFFNAVEKNKYVRFIDDEMFLIDEMTVEEWSKMFDSVKGTIIEKPKTYLMRWNPAISAFTLDEYMNCFNQFDGCWCMDWSIWEWSNAKKGDRFFMLREGDGVNSGIVFRGIFTSLPYEDNDWRGSKEKRHYIKLDCWDASLPGEEAKLTLEELEAYIPEINWSKGHSGQLLTDLQADKIESLWNAKFPEAVEEDEIENSDGSFYHPDHLSTIDENPFSVLMDFMDATEKYKPIAQRDEYIVFGEKGRHMLSLHALCSYNEELGDYSVKDFIPVLLNNKSTGLFKLTDIHESSDGKEGILTVAYGDLSISFYDIDYFINRDCYFIGDFYHFAISGFAYDVEIVPEDELLIRIPAQRAEEMKLALNPGEDEVTIYAHDIIAFIQDDNEDKANAGFQSPVMSSSGKCSVLGRELCVMNICICPVIVDGDGNDALPQLDIPLAYRAQIFTSRPRKGTPVRGKIWLQGKLHK